MDIDFVVLWVDGNDPAWQAEKAKYQGKTLDDGNSVNRYRDWGLLPYWFRAIENYAPWVRKVHFVTWGHVPAFLNLDAPKLHVVRHSDFIPEEYLPTFSSHTIEMNIHRIPDLAEHFVYFNDDMFLLRPMQETDFFRDGLPCTYGREVPWVFNGPVGIWEHAVANNLGVINRHFSKKAAIAHHGDKFYCKQYRWKDNIRTWVLNQLFPDYFTGFKNLHAPAAYLKRTFEEVWEAEPELLINTCRDKFRAASNVNQWVCLWWQIASGRFSPCTVDSMVASISEATIDSLCGVILSRTHAFVCLNDPEESIEYEKLAASLYAVFERVLPDKCQFEK